MARDISEPELRGYLRDEYLLLQGNFEDFDRRALSIKGWVASGTIAALAIAFQGPEKYAYVIPGFAIVLALTFWVLETTWKLFQQALRDRIRVIEAYFRGDADIILKDPPPFQTYTAGYSSFFRDAPIYPYEADPPKDRPSAAPMRPKSIVTRFWRASWHPFVCLPYAVIIVLSVATMFLMQKPTVDHAGLWLELHASA